MDQANTRLLLISNMYPSKHHPSFGIFVKKFEEAIETEGFSFTAKAVVPGQGKDFLTKCYKYIRFYFDIIFAVLRNNYDIIYVHYISNSAPALYVVKAFIRRPLVINFHGGDLLLENGLERYTRFLSRPLIKKADLIVVPSGYFRRLFLDHYSMPDEKVYVYPSGGIDLNVFKPSNRDALKTTLGLTGHLTFGYVSRIVRDKGWDVFLKALHLFRQHYPDTAFKAIVAGTGDMVDHFLKLLKVLQLEGYVIYMGEKKNHELPDIYSLSDVFVFSTSLPESLGLVGLEAMACGTPVIGSNIGGIKSYLVPDVNGFLFEPSDENDLFLKMKTFVMLTPEEKEKLQINARHTARQYEKKNVTIALGKRLKKLFHEKN